MIATATGRHDSGPTGSRSLLAGLSIGLLFFDGWVMLGLDYHAATAVAVLREFVFARSVGSWSGWSRSRLGGPSWPGGFWSWRSCWPSACPVPWI